MLLFALHESKKGKEELKQEFAHFLGLAPGAGWLYVTYCLQPGRKVAVTNVVFLRIYIIRLDGHFFQKPSQKNCAIPRKGNA